MVDVLPGGANTRFGKWIEQFPWTKTLALFGIFLVWTASQIAALTWIAFVLWPHLRPGIENEWLVKQAIDVYKDTCSTGVYLALAGTLGIVGKTAFRKADVVAAEAAVLGAGTGTTAKVETKTTTTSVNATGETAASKHVLVSNIPTEPGRGDDESRD